MYLVQPQPAIHDMGTAYDVMASQLLPLLFPRSTTMRPHRGWAVWSGCMRWTKLRHLGAANRCVHHRPLG